MTKTELNKRLDSMELSEIEELLILFFRKMHLRNGNTVLSEKILYFDLTEAQGDPNYHILGCWLSEAKYLNPTHIHELLEQFKSTLGSEKNFQEGLILSPLEFAESVEEEAKTMGVTLIDLPQLSQLFEKYDLTDFFPGPLERFGKNLGNALRYLAPLLIVCLGVLVYQWLTPSKPVLTSPVSTQPILTQSQKNEIKKPVQPVSTQIVQPSKPASKPEHPIHRIIPVQHPVIVVQPIREKPRPSKKKAPLAKRMAERVRKHYSNVYVLDQKYYGIAQQSEAMHLKAQARRYYQQYLRVSPNGPHAEEARRKLQEL